MLLAQDKVALNNPHHHHQNVHFLASAIKTASSWHHFHPPPTHPLKSPHIRFLSHSSHRHPRVSPNPHFATHTSTPLNSYPSLERPFRMFLSVSAKIRSIPIIMIIMSPFLGAASCPSTPLSHRRVMGDWSSLNSPGWIKKPTMQWLDFDAH